MLLDVLRWNIFIIPLIILTSTFIFVIFITPYQLINYPASLRSMVHPVIFEYSQQYFPNCSEDESFLSCRRSQRLQDATYVWKPENTPGQIYKVEDVSSNNTSYHIIVFCIRNIGELTYLNVVIKTTKIIEQFELFTKLYFMYKNLFINRC